MSIEVKDFHLNENMEIEVHCLDRFPGEFEVGESLTATVPIFKGFAELSEADKRKFLQNYINSVIE